MKIFVVVPKAAGFCAHAQSQEGPLWVQLLVELFQNGYRDQKVPHHSRGTNSLHGQDSHSVTLGTK